MLPRGSKSAWIRRGRVTKLAYFRSQYISCFKFYLVERAVAVRFGVRNSLAHYLLYMTKLSFVGSIYGPTFVAHGNLGIDGSYPVIPFPSGGLLWKEGPLPGGKWCFIPGGIATLDEDLGRLLPLFMPTGNIPSTKST